jgi:hypothetical protein
LRIRSIRLEESLFIEASVYIASVGIEVEGSTFNDSCLAINFWYYMVFNLGCLTISSINLVAGKFSIFGTLTLTLICSIDDYFFNRLAIPGKL